LKKAGEKVVPLGHIRARKGREAQVAYSGSLSA
jgi:hypothetical protein